MSEAAVPEQGYVSKYLTHFVGRDKSTAEQYEILKKILIRRWLTHAPHLEQPTLNTEIHRSRAFSENDMLMPAMLCFCDVPEEHLRIHTGKYSQFGIAFEKAYLVARGANPVMYVARNSTAPRKRPEFRRPPTKTTVTHQEYEALKSKPAAAEKFADEPRSALFDEHVKEMFDLLYAKEPFAKSQGKEWEALADLMIRDKVMWMFFIQHLLAYIKFFDDTLHLEDPDNFCMEREWRRFGNLTHRNGFYG